MRALTRTATLAILVLAGSALVSAQRQLALLATVNDPSGGEVSALDPKEVRVAENGEPATIVKVEPVQRVPKLQVLIDNGLGMPSESVGDLRKALQAFLEALPATLEVTLVTTAPNPRILEKATTDRARLLQAITRLTPDSGAGRFVESLVEAMDRIDKDKQDSSYTILALGTTSGDNDARDSDLKKITQYAQSGRTTVYAAIFTRTTGGNRIQMDVGQSLAGATGGRYETFNVANRVLTLLPEMGAQIAKASGPGAKQFRITFDRPGKATGDLGKVTLGIDGKLVTGVTLDRSAARR